MKNLKVYDTTHIAPSGERITVLALMETLPRVRGVRRQRILERQYFVNDKKVTAEAARRVAQVDVFNGQRSSRAA